MPILLFSMPIYSFFMLFFLFHV